jgi:hypothetical protein
MECRSWSSLVSASFLFNSRRIDAVLLPALPKEKVRVLA